MDPISINIPKDKLQTLAKLLKIASEARRINGDLVDLKEKICALPETDIIALRDKITELIS